MVLEGRVNGIARSSVSLCTLPDLTDAEWNNLLSPFSSLTMIWMFSAVAESEEDEVTEAFDAVRERMVAEAMVDGGAVPGLKYVLGIKVLMEAAGRL